MLYYLKRAVLLVLGAVLVFVALNWDYFYKQARFLLNKPAVVFEDGAAPGPDETAEPNRLWIPKLGVEAPLVYSEATDEAGFQLALQNGVVHYPKTAKPGEPGNAYFFGHSSDYPTAPGSYKSVFALLTRTQAGDRIEVTAEDGRLYRYLVDETRVIDPDDFSVLEQDSAQKRLTLQTSYPIGTALKRFIVIATLQE